MERDAKPKIEFMKDEKCGCKEKGMSKAKCTCGSKPKSRAKATKKY